VRDDAPHRLIDEAAHFVGVWFEGEGHYLAVGSWQLAVGSWQLAVGGWRLAVLFAVFGWQLPFVVLRFFRQLSQEQRATDKGNLK
jgi:hypothetical protein